jgi:hypothetical protein
VLTLPKDFLSGDASVDTLVECTTWRVNRELSLILLEHLLVVISKSLDLVDIRDLWRRRLHMRGLVADQNEQS